MRCDIKCYDRKIIKLGAIFGGKLIHGKKSLQGKI